MEKLKDLGFDEYLRNVFSGGITLFAWIVLSPDKVGFLVIKGALSQGFVLFGLSLLIGVLIYSIHRAIIYPRLVQRFFLMLVYWEYRRKGFKVCVTKFAILSWERLKDEKDSLHHIRKWASKFHFLWCTSWGVVGTLAWLSYSHPDIGWTQFAPFRGFCVLAFVTFGSACVDTFRAMKHEQNLLSVHEKQRFLIEKTKKGGSMRNAVLVIIGLAALGFLLAAISTFAGSIMGIGALGFSRGSTNLALIAIALGLWVKEGGKES